MPTTPVQPTHLGFQIIYDGPALREGLVGTRDLALALLSVGNLAEQINHRLNHDNPPAHLYFRATKQGLPNYCPTDCSLRSSVSTRVLSASASSLSCLAS